MTSQLDFTGERFVPGIPGEIAHEHWHRYAFARRFVAGRRVLDVACGEGYGSALLAAVAGEVTGVDIAEEAIAHARATYAAVANLRYVQASAAELPLPDASVDVVVSFETIEHLPQADQPRMIAEIARVLVPGGIVVMSAPNPVEYSQARNYRNPFHTHEPSRDELGALLAQFFPAQRWLHQRRWFGSAIWNQAAEGTAALAAEAWQGDASRIEAAHPPAAMYFVVVAAREEASLPAPLPAVSLFSDVTDTELGRLDAQASEVLRLDALLRERDAAIDRATGHIHHLEELVAVRERLVEERDAQLRTVHAALEGNEARARVEIARLQQLFHGMVAERDAALVARDSVSTALRSQEQASAALAAEIDRLQGVVGEREREIAYRQSARWWLALPFHRLRALLRGGSR